MSIVESDKNPYDGGSGPRWFPNSISLLGTTMLREFSGGNVTLLDVFEGVVAHAICEISDEELYEQGSVERPGPGLCREVHSKYNRCDE